MLLPICTYTSIHFVHSPTRISIPRPGHLWLAANEARSGSPVRQSRSRLAARPTRACGRQVRLSRLRSGPAEFSLPRPPEMAAGSRRLSSAATAPQLPAVTTPGKRLIVGVHLRLEASRQVGESAAPEDEQWVEWRRCSVKRGRCSATPSRERHHLSEKTVKYAGPREDVCFIGRQIMTTYFT
ncbi:unnamed protein product [Protopolystoma xenopodis]|uniref:Uncharacterized protein n=1 Tax=Protopolystoma xenopodis TaxID=117903 RepID=A0A448XDN7_9PLAT|nr:unnamed protein product [Protopolystoma xenopodis]